MKNYWNITTKNLLVNEQFDFKSKLPTEMASCDLLEILDAFNNNTLVGGIFCDLEKLLTVSMTVSY